jgi:putative phage-type endonuclease
MIIHDLVQGSPEWHAHRAKYLNASETPAMLGESKYKTRDQLLHEAATGMTAEVDAGTQRAFDNGHKFEALARPLAEKIVGEDLYPVVGTDGIYGASFDGITMGEDIIFEHKTLNEDLRRIMFKVDGERFSDLPLMYRAQMEHQLMVSGAAKCLFMASKWNGDILEEERHCWYLPDLQLRQRIIDGWNQFKADLDAYVPPVRIEKVEAEEVKALPVPSVVVRGEVTVSNLHEITPLFDNYLAEVKTELSNDQDFADAEANAKNCRETAKRIQALRANIIAQMVDVNTVDSTLANYEDAFNKVGLRLEKAVKEQKETLKTTAIMKAKVAYADFVTELNKDISVMLSQRLVCPDFATAIKGVKTIETMQSRINDALANGKTEATTLANDVKAKLAYITEATKGYEHLIDVHQLAFSDLDYIKLHIQSVKDAEDKRKAEHEAAIKAKAEADARAKLEAEAKARELSKEILANGVVVDASIPEGDGIKNDTIKEPEIKYVIDLKEQPAVQTVGKRPTAQAIINLVATTYKVDADTASRWLAQSFGELKAA